jgi:aminomethyltransferase
MVIADKETVSLDAAYVAAHEGAILVDRSDLGVLKFTGATRLDLIHRMSTQVVNGLASGAGTATILTTDIGRMIDRLRLYAASDAVYAVTGENNAGNVAAYLQRFVFYNDDFHSEDLTAETAILGVYGTHAPAWLRPLFGDSVDIPRHHWRQHDWDGVAVYLHRTDPVAGEGYLVMVDRDDAGSVTERLLDAGIVFAGPEAFEYLRIEAGLPRFGHEITEDYIPLEANLWADVSFNKGCYTGQEIIARMESRGRLAKQLARLHPAKPLAVGAEILADGRNAGVVTSAADGPAGPLALGYVKTKALDEAGADYSSGGVALQPAPLPRADSA